MRNSHINEQIALIGALNSPFKWGSAFKRPPVGDS